jgi:Ran GTPase-activating protein 1
MDHPNLVELDLSDNAFGPAGAKPLIPFLSYHTQLETLKLNNNGLGVFGATHIAEALIAAGQKNEKEGKKSNLKTIIIGRNRLENGSSEVMAKAIGYHKESLETVRMIQNGIRPEGIANLMGGLSQCPNLIHLDLQDNTFTTSGSKALAKALPSWPKLQILNVGDCMLEPKGGLEVLKTLKANTPKDLETLQLQYDELRIDSAQVILELIPLIPKLKSLELNGNQFPEDSDIVEKIKEALNEEDILGSLSDMEELSDEEDEEDEDEDEEVDELAEDLKKVHI